ncbi:hypothetical protein [Streptomyces sp. NPDC058086]|uniref:hypothetical protein n=1 Tax=Streptomyces sp. NPDC058086 TaxID=3346334 RepID=UPI0036EBC288
MPEKIARLVRSQWAIENRLHFLRDTTFDEDRSQVRTGRGRENGHTNIAAGIREMSYQPFTRPLDLLGLTPWPSNYTKIERLCNNPGHRHAWDTERNNDAEWNLK